MSNINNTFKLLQQLKYCQSLKHINGQFLC